MKADIRISKQRLEY